jgi:hypothetical protein
MIRAASVPREATPEGVSRQAPRGPGSVAHADDRPCPIDRGPRADRDRGRRIFSAVTEFGEPRILPALGPGEVPSPRPVRPVKRPGKALTQHSCYPWPRSEPEAVKRGSVRRESTADRGGARELFHILRDVAPLKHQDRRPAATALAPVHPTIDAHPS